MKTTLENNKLTLFLEGRVDTNNASAVEAELFAAVNANPGAETVVDAEKLELPLSMQSTEPETSRFLDVLEKKHAESQVKLANAISFSSFRKEGR